MKNGNKLIGKEGSSYGYYLEGKIFTIVDIINNDVIIEPALSGNKKAIYSYINKNDIQQLFYTQAEWREKQIKSIIF